MREVADVAPTLVWMIDASGRWTFLGTAMRALFSAAPLYLEHWLQFVHPDDQAPVRDTLAVARAERSDFKVEHRVVRSDGSVRWMLSLGAPRFAPDGTFRGYGGATIDISAKHEAVARLAASEASYRLLADENPVLICHCNADSVYTYVSPSYHRVLGIEASALIGENAYERVHPDDRAALRGEAQRQLRAPAERGEPPVVEVRLRHRDGHYVWVASKVRMLADPHSGRKTGSVVVSRDITAERALRDRLAQLAEENRALIENSPDALIVFDNGGRIRRAEGAVSLVLGYGAEALVDRCYADFLVADAAPAQLDSGGVTPATVDQLPQRVTGWRRADGGVVYLAWSVRRSRGQPQLAYATARDVTDVHRARVELAAANQQLLATLESIGDAFFSVDSEWRLTYVNLKTARFVNRAREELVGKLLWEAVPEVLGSSVFPRYQEAMRTGASTFFEDYYEPAQAWVEVRAYPHAAGMAVYFHDISERKRASDQLEYLATHDVLTGLPNRLASRRHLQQLLDAADATVAVMFVDLDRFKLINDSMGHLAGDNLLQQVAQRFRQALGADELIARFGGDEFVATACCRGGLAQAAALAAALQGTLEAPFRLAGEDVFVGASVGIALSAPDARSHDVLFQNANTALFRAKARGRNQHCFFEDGMANEARERIALEGALRRALEHDEFALHYQPQVDLGTGRVVGVEALLRWQHPEWGFVAPERFIAVAEESGLIVPIGAWVLHAACQQAAAWHAAGLGPLRVAVNLSARQFAQADLAQTVAAALEASGLAPDALDLELTESMVASDLDRTVEILARLKQLGIQLSIDDFGTGYSSLAHLKRFPLDVLKIDRSFVQELGAGASGAAIPDAIIAMAHSLGIRVIAEGVETEAQCALLARKMCDEIQGFLFAAALPAPEVELLLRSARVLPPHLLRMHRRPPTLLLVDDEPNILRALRRVLRGSDCHILTAGSGAEGLAVLAAQQVDVIVSDQRMPGMTGVDFLRAVKRLYPETVRIVLSGYTELDAVTSAVNEGAIYKFLTKPWDDAQLRGHIADAVAHKQMADDNRRLNMEVLAANQGLAAANRRLEAVLQQPQQHLPRDAAAAGASEGAHH
jgi:diguanylate cyclase (GGDEF)-like protein/PAS domain S-box-containing protein